MGFKGKIGDGPTRGNKPRNYSSGIADEIDSQVWSKPTKSELDYWNKEIAKLESAEKKPKKKTKPKAKKRKPKKPPVPIKPSADKPKPMTASLSWVVTTTLSLAVVGGNATRL
jgi:hypothetical protein